MINKLWTDVSLENYNNWYPLTGKITETPQQYIQTWPNVNDWFKTFAIRAQNDINAYLDFILSKFPFDSFKDELIKETLRDMVYVMVEHWVFNRTPIEFNVDATIQFNNGSQFSANSTPTINVWDLAPSRMKIWARLTELKQIFSSYNDDEIDIEKIDLKAFYTRNQVDELIEQQKEFTLSKQIKLYDDLVDDNENEIYRGPVSKFVNKGYVATDYDKETETMILDWPDEIGTLPPEALQNNPQIGDYTHAPTCDFSAKQQKRITTNENEITKLNTELIKANENINDVKNNWFNIETSPLWKKVKNENIKTDTWCIIDWTYYFIDSKQLIISNNKLTKSNIRITNSQIEQKQIIIENIDVNIDKVTLLYDVDLIKFIATNNTKKYKPIIHNIYQYQGIGTPTEFIAEENTERDYYTKLETNNLLDKKQNKLIAGENIKIDEKTNTISTTGGKADLSDYYKKEEVNKKLEDTKALFPIAFSMNAIGQEIPTLETEHKTIVDAINQNKNNIDKKQDKENWVVIGKKVDNRTWDNFNIDLNKTYRVFITWHRNAPEQNGYPLMLLFKSAKAVGTGTWTLLIGKIDNKDASLILKADYTKSTNKWSLFIKCEIDGGAIFSFEELKENTYQITSNTLDITSPSVINIDKPIKISSKSLETNEIEENIWDIELKNNPTPIPSGSNWKEVGTREKNKWDNWQITYDFQENKHYRVYYSWSIYNPVYTIQEFIITDKKIAGVQIQTFNDSANIVILSVQHAKLITIYTVKGNLKGNVWKLEELQE
ncbi:hypothetical protein [Spiroplasma endosymbiont of Dasysyrphus albostriatus]|uniref:hypothetical protein n=1 Tax=Spiroplasma endosymbiont of Dasysyrphus albostriatus TaxID=3066299 RepID=UPI0030CDE2FF